MTSCLPTTLHVAKTQNIIIRSMLFHLCEIEQRIIFVALKQLNILNFAAIKFLSSEVLVFKREKF